MGRKKLNITTFFKAEFESEDGSIREFCYFPQDDEYTIDFLNKFEGHTFSLVTAYSNCNLTLGKNNNEITYSESIYEDGSFEIKKNRVKLSNLKCDKHTFKMFSEFCSRMKILNMCSDIRIVRGITDFVTRNIDEVYDIIIGKKYVWVERKDIQKFMEKNFEKILESHSNLSILDTIDGTLFLFDEKYCKEGVKRYQTPIIIEGEPYEEIGVCSICGGRYYHWGNNAFPINDGRCCDYCNFERVIPMRCFNSDAYKKV